MIVVLHGGRVPFRATRGSAGLDLISPVDATVPPRGRTTLDLGVSFRLDGAAYAARLYGRSGLFYEKGITVVGETEVPSTAHESLTVTLSNADDEPFEIRAGTRIAQLVLERRGPAPKSPDTLHATKRVTVHPGERALIPTGKVCRFPRDVCAVVRSTALGPGLPVFRGLVDSDYERAVGCVVVNDGAAPVVIHAGDVVGRVCYEKLYDFDTLYVHEGGRSWYESDARPVERGTGGFGSTGCE